MKRRITISHSINPFSPREDDNIGIMACSHSRYNLGDDDQDPQDIPDDAIAQLPLYLYDHSGITMNTTGFSCGWDSGQVGVIYITPERIAEVYDGHPIPTVEKLQEYLRSEVEVYYLYLRGEVFGFLIEECNHCDSCNHDEWKHVDSCSGFFGRDWKDNGLLDHVDIPAVIAEGLEVDESIEYEVIETEII